MSTPIPHYLLFSDATAGGSSNEPGGGEWRFVLEAVAGGHRLEAASSEPNVSFDRLALLAVVRGLEALDQPSCVTLVTTSRYVARGLRFGLPAWRDTRWQWERNGSLEPIKNADLWQRVGRALEFHELHCRVWRFDLSAENTGNSGNSIPAPHYSPTRRHDPRATRPRSLRSSNAMCLSPLRGLHFGGWQTALARFARRLVGRRDVNERGMSLSAAGGSVA